MSNLKKTTLLSPVYPGNETTWILTVPPVYPVDFLSRLGFRGESVISLRLGKRLVNFLQVSVERD